MNREANYRREVEKTQAQFRERLDQKAASHTEIQTAKRTPEDQRHRLAIDRMTKEIKEFNEKAGNKVGEGESFQACGDSAEKARDYAVKRAESNVRKKG